MAGIIGVGTLMEMRAVGIANVAKTITKDADVGVLEQAVADADHISKGLLEMVGSEGSTASTESIVNAAVTHIREGVGNLTAILGEDTGIAAGIPGRNTNGIDQAKMSAQAVAHFESAASVLRGEEPVMTLG